MSIATTHAEADASRPTPLPDGVEVVSVRPGDTWDAADRFLYGIYRESGFCEPSTRGVVEELTPWTDRAVYHVAVHVTDGVCGTVRTITDDLCGLPIAGFDLDDAVADGRVSELSSLAVMPGRRGGGVVEYLYRAGWMDALRSGSSWLAGLVDPWLFDVFVEHYHLPFRQVGRPKLHMGAEVVPVGMDLAGPAYVPLSMSRPGFWDWTLEGLTAAEVERFAMPDPRGVHSRELPEFTAEAACT